MNPSSLDPFLTQNSISVIKKDISDGLFKHKQASYWTSYTIKSNLASFMRYVPGESPERQQYRNYQWTFNKNAHRLTQLHISMARLKQQISLADPNLRSPLNFPKSNISLSLSKKFPYFSLQNSEDFLSFFPPMAESNETHVVEIPVDSQTDQQNLNSEQIQHHPLTEISESPGHLLLLKLFQREEDQLSRRIGLKETRLDDLKREAFYLSSLFFAFHGLFFTLLFTSSITQSDGKACKNWWVPCFLSLLTSVVLISSVQMKIRGYWKVLRGLNREKSDGRGIARLVMELRMKGKSFDLNKELMVGKRMMKSSSVEIEWRPLRFLKQNLVTICLVGFSGLVVPACKFVLCN